MSVFSPSRPEANEYALDFGMYIALVPDEASREAGLVSHPNRYETGLGTQSCSLTTML